MNSDTILHQGHRNLCKNILILAVIIIGRFAVELMYSVIHSKFQLQNANLPSDYELKAIFDLLQNFAREQGHVPSAMELHSRANQKDHMQRVVLIVLSQIQNKTENNVEKRRK